MAYTVIILSRHGSSSRTFDVPRPLAWVVLGWAVAAPLLAFAFGWISSPVKHQVQAYKDHAAVAELTTRVGDLEIQRDTLQTQLDTERASRAQAETKAAIVDNARATAAERLEKTESDLADKTWQLSVYEDLLQPSKERLPLQCYNLEITPSEKQVSYSFQMLKTDPKDKDEIEIFLRMRLLSGPSVMALDASHLNDVDREFGATITQSRSFSGILRTNTPKDGLRLFDARVYDKSNKLIGHCWKAF